jgi:hypothetical protein
VSWDEQWNSRVLGLLGAVTSPESSQEKLEGSSCDRGRKG